MSLSFSLSLPRLGLWGLVASGWLATGAAAVAASGVDFVPGADGIEIKVDGQLLTVVRFKDGPKPYYYPLLGPGGVPVTRNYPMRDDATDEEKDHPHHRSLWFTHGEVNGVDFWAEGPNKGRIVHQKVLRMAGGADSGELWTSNRWMTVEGKGVLSDETRLRVWRRPSDRMFDYEVTLFASEGADVVFGDTKEGTMGMRLAESMRLKPNRHYAGQPTGHILQSTGVKDGATWGKRAAWTAYTGPAQGKTMTVTIFDHPSNPRYPTWWHVRDYGLFAANPFGIHDFERKPAGTGDFTVKAGDRVTFRYRFLIQAGEAEATRLEQVAKEFAASSR